MLDKLPILDLASAMARHAALGHRVIAENVAQADTPGYKARELQPFSVKVNEAFTPRATRPGHLAAGADEVLVRSRIVEADLPAAPNGNTVSLPEQAVRSVRTEGRHAMALAVYSKTMEILRIGLGRR